MSKAHALVIDDNINSIHVIAGLLAMEDVSSTTLNDSRQLDANLENTEAIDVVFLDLEMPGLTGYDVIEILQADPRFEQVPVVAYTVHVSEMDVAVQHGFHSFLGKPLDADKFPGQLSRILHGEHVWDRF